MYLCHKINLCFLCYQRPYLEHLTKNSLLWHFIYSTVQLEVQMWVLKHKMKQMFIYTCHLILIFAGP